MELDQLHGEDSKVPIECRGRVHAWLGTRMAEIDKALGPAPANYPRTPTIEDQVIVWTNDRRNIL
jgi:hypothetical protein